MGLLLCGLAGPQTVAAQTTCTMADTAVSGLSGTKTVTGSHNDIVDDCTTLLGLKATLIGTSTNAVNWATSVAMTSWDGVTLTGNTSGSTPRVTKLELTDKNLTGTVPAALGNLSALTTLALVENTPIYDMEGNIISGLSGSIPPALGNLSALTTLDLSSNRLSGAIPAGVDTGGNPTGLAKLANLEDLDLSRNQLSGAIPAGVDTSTNPATPTGLAKLANLEDLNLSRNDLSGAIPAALGALANLEDLDLSRNQLSGAIPAGVDTGGNPTGLAKLASLETLFMGYNDLSGVIPAALGALANLKFLTLEANNISGAIPAALGELSSLEWLRVGFNEGLSGSLPSATGSFPSATGSWKALKELDLFGTAVCVPARFQIGLTEMKIVFDPSGITCDVMPLAEAEITLAVFYTAAVRVAAGGKTEIEADINEMVATANRVYEGSGVQQRLALVAR